MDWFSIALLILFFVLPIIQQVLEQARRNQAPPPEWEDLDGGVGRTGTAELPTPRRTPTAERSSGDSGWSEGWTPWPTEETPEPEPRTGPKSGQSTGTSGWSDDWSPWPTEKVSTEPEPWTAPKPSQRTPPTPPVEERRPVLAELPRAEPRSLPAAIERSTIPRTRPPVAPRNVEIRVARPTPAAPAERLFASPEDVRRAVILSEVLGPPLALRSSDPDLPY